MKGVLVTGGTGTFGHAFVPRLLELPIERIVILSRDELKVAEMMYHFRDHWGSKRLNFFVGDVRDQERLEMAMRGVSVVVHAAALKRIEICEAEPIEAVKTNIVGTINVIQAALRQPAMSNIVALSTDKACNPVNHYGATKLAMERLVIAANNIAGGRAKFGVVRYGNIFGSRGSVVRIWQDMIAKGCKKVPITDPDVTRFFMTTTQAVKLVADYMQEVDMPPFRQPYKMPAYRLGDLAEAMNVDIAITGLGVYEKLHEEITPGHTSDLALRMTVPSLRHELKELGIDPAP